jgi:hypothetical protein
MGEAGYGRLLPAGRAILRPAHLRLICSLPADLANFTGNLTVRGRNANRTKNYPIDFLRNRRIRTGWYVIVDAEEAATQDGKAARS